MNEFSDFVIFISCLITALPFIGGVIVLGVYLVIRKRKAKGMNGSADGIGNLARKSKLMETDIFRKQFLPDDVCVVFEAVLGILDDADDFGRQFYPIPSVCLDVVLGTVRYSADYLPFLENHKFDIAIFSRRTGMLALPITLPVAGNARAVKWFLEKGNIPGIHLEAKHVFQIRNGEIDNFGSTLIEKLRDVAGKFII